MAYSIELKQKALAYLDQCGNISAVCIAYDISRSTLYAWIKKQEQGDLSCQSGGSRGFKVDRDKLKTYVEQNPDAYFEQDPQKVKDDQDRLNQLQSTQDDELVYIDETGIDTYLHRTHARSLKGQKVYDKVSGKRYQRLSLVAGQLGNKAKNLIAPFVYKNTMTSRLFETWFEQMLLPCLDKPSIIILDNARFHRMKHLQALANNTTYKHIILPLPPYSPNLNPIERTWATIKKWLRSHLSKFDSIEGGLVYYLGLN